MGSFLFFEAFREINTPYYERETISSNGRAADKSVGCWFKSNIVSLLFFWRIVLILIFRKDKGVWMN